MGENDAMYNQDNYDEYGNDDEDDFSGGRMLLGIVTAYGMGTSNPFVKVLVADQPHRQALQTSPLKDLGGERWDQEATFEVAAQESFLALQILDQDHPDYLGEVFIDLRGLQTVEEEYWLEVEPQGKILVK